MAATTPAASSIVDLTMNVADLNVDDDGHGSEMKEGDFFPLLRLPNEVLLRIFSKCLDIKDRLRARVNRRLFHIETMEDYRLPTLNICYSRWTQNRLGLEMVLTRPISIYSDGLGKLALNYSFIEIYLVLEGTRDAAILDDVAGVPSEDLSITMRDHNLLTTDRILALCERRASVRINHAMPSLETDLLFRLFNSMVDSHPLHKIDFHGVREQVVKGFLRLLGIRGQNSTLRDIEMYGSSLEGCIDRYGWIVIGGTRVIRQQKDNEGAVDLTFMRYNADGKVPVDEFAPSVRRLRRVPRLPVTYVEQLEESENEEEEE